MTGARERKITGRRKNAELGAGRYTVGHVMMNLDDLRVDPAIQQRATEIDQATVEEYADRLLGGDDAPAIDVFGDPVDPDAGYWVADGFHRVAAYRLAGAKVIHANLRLGGRRAALCHALSANQGLRRTNACKRKAVTTALDDELWAAMSDRDIARLCGVGHAFVSNMRAERKKADNLEPVSTVDTETAETLPPPDPSLPPSAPTRVEPDPEGGGDLYPTRSPPDGAWTAGPLEPTPRIEEAIRPPKATEDQVDRAARQIRGIFLPAANPPVTLERLRYTAEEPGSPPDLYRRAIDHGVEQGWWRLDGDVVSMPSQDDDDAPPEAPSPIDTDADTDDESAAPATPLPNDERAVGDSYWTPDATALACLRWLVGPGHPGIHVLPPHFTAVEPAVGGGAWVRALRAVSQGTHVDRVDLDPAAPGLGGARRGLEQSWRNRSWLDPLPSHAFTKRTSWDLCLGNPPYGGDLVRWLEVSLERASVVAYLLRETVTGSAERLPWWLEHRPAWICKVLPRPRWEGPGQRETSDYVDHVFVVWVRGVEDTRWDWIDCRGSEP